MTSPVATDTEATAELTQEAVNAIRALSFHGVEAANSGHPGMPMGAADIAYVLWTKFLKHNPDDPEWPDRDRFVLSAGHGSMLLYSLLHLTGYEDLTLEELKNFRQLGSKTAGHPEYGHARGIETTTGPLGQGVGNAVGMALAEAMLAARVNTNDVKLVDHYTYAICGDGDLMEGVASEACSLAGHLGLSKLIMLYDDNGISIDGSTELSFTGENVGARFEAYGWHVQSIDGHDHAAIEAAIEAAQNDGRPSIICARTIIGYGAPNKQNTAGVHGSPLGADELEAARQQLNWSYPPFEVPIEIRNHFKGTTESGRAAHAEWTQKKSSNADQAKALDSYLNTEIDASTMAELPKLEEGSSIATRKSSNAVINALLPKFPWLVGGSADLTGSNGTQLSEGGNVEPGDFAGRYIHFGVREHGMAAICNGMALHGGFVPFGATFLVFTDYCRPSIRLSALMKQRVIYIMTHDSIFLGEDGPTHQPVEHLEALRAIPGVNVLRPTPAETAAAWVAALQYQGPTVLVLTRQGLPVRNTASIDEGVLKGAYILTEGQRGPDDLDLVILATGSETHLAQDAQAELEKDGKSVRVVSMVSEYLFEQQSDDYKASVLPVGVKRFAVEAGVTRGWHKWVGLDGGVHGIDRFGASAPASDLALRFGFTPEILVMKMQEVIGS